MDGLTLTELASLNLWCTSVCKKIHTHHHVASGISRISRNEWSTKVFSVCVNILGMLKKKSIAAQLNQQASIYITELYHCISIFKKVSWCNCICLWLTLHTLVILLLRCLGIHETKPKLCLNSQTKRVWEKGKIHTTDQTDNGLTKTDGRAIEL